MGAPRKKGETAEFGHAARWLTVLERSEQLFRFQKVKTFKDSRGGTKRKRTRTRSFLGKQNFGPENEGPSAADRVRQEGLAKLQEIHA